MLHRASACCTIRRLPKPTFCRERCRRRSSSSSSRRKAGTGISTSFPPSRRACGICVRCRPRRRKPPREIEKRARISGSVTANGVLPRRVEVGFVKEIEGFLTFGEQLLVAVAATARSLEQRFHSRGLGDRRTARLEIMHERSDSRERPVVVQAEFREQLLECYLVPAVGEGRAVETEPNRRRRARSEEHTSELQSLAYLVCRLLLEKKNTKQADCNPHGSRRRFFGPALRA